VSGHLVFDDELLAAVRGARPGFSEELSPTGAQAQAALERALAARRRRGSRWRRAARGAPLALAIGATVAVVVVAVITLRGHNPAGVAGTGGHGVRGAIVDRDGTVLSPGPAVGSGLGVYYRAALTRGETLRTSLDPSLQSAGQQALRHAIAANPPADGGAFVALDPENGQVYAMGSIPNRATEPAEPVGATFTPITALAGLESGAWSVGQAYDDTGQVCFEGECRHNAGRAVDGVLDVASALKVSSEDFFANLGELTGSSGALQEWAHAFGIGRPTGIDLPAENIGGWRHGATNGAQTINRNINLAVGQGGLEVTPLQLAVAYAAIENGGTIVRPAFGIALEGRDRSVLRMLAARPARHLNIDPVYLGAVRAGLRAAASQPGGTSADVFARLGVPVYGETGSAQENGGQNNAWYAGFIPGANGIAPIVVVVTVDHGGFGDVAAAPVARQIFSQWVFRTPGPWVAGASHTF
jgi:penicillin-binding protein 2